MPVKFVGRKVDYVGKTLWEILGNLKNFGVGRLVVKDHFHRYPEKSYYKILRVQPVQGSEDKSKPDRCVMVWAQCVFRGKEYPEPVMMHRTTYQTKFQLIPKSEESKYLLTSADVSDRKSPVAPCREFPPVFQVFLEQESKKQGKTHEPYLKSLLQLGPSAVTVVDESILVQPNYKPQLFKTSLSVASMKQEIEKLSEKIKEKTVES